MDALIVHKSPYKKNRVGRHNDGGYVIADLPGPYDCLIGCGIANDISFEQEFLTDYPSIPCFAFDGSIKSLPVNDSRITFIQKYVGAQENESYTKLHKYTESYSNIFMKMDIEGHEFSVLTTLSTDQMKKIKQFVIEIHTPNEMHLHPEFYEGLAHVNETFMLFILEKFKKTHTLIHVHPNNTCKTHMINNVVVPNVFECTYIRNDFVGQRLRSDQPIPGPLDMVNNIYNPEIHLSGYPWNTL